MTTVAPRRPAVIALACVVALCSAVAVSHAGAQGERNPDVAPGSAKPTPYIYGARHCAACHDQGNGGKMTQSEINGMICRMVEFPIYAQHDKHTLAFKALSGPRGEEMTRLLGYDVQKSEACLNCHSTADHGKGKQLYEREVDGVTCVACHGAAAEWVEIHQRTDKSGWRDLDRKTKQIRYGMIDLWDPVRRAETCASCHVGNHADGKVVTHAMYAAGHPPLPGFEAATFGDLQPRHWENLADKSPERARRLDPKIDRRNLEQSQLVAISGLVAFRESIKLFADQAGDRPDRSDAPWPDFARFDCTACHHDLQTANGASSRQLRRRGGEPGRPLSLEWPQALIALGIEAAGRAHAPAQAAQLKERLGAFEQGLKARPFGDPELAVPAARNLVQWADSLIQSFDGTIVDASMARRFLQKLCTMATETHPDYDSARQIAWAFRVIYHESVPISRRDPVIDSILTEFGKELSLDLSPSPRQAPIESSLRQRLNVSAEFDSKGFQAQFATVAQRIATLTPEGGSN